MAARDSGGLGAVGRGIDHPASAGASLAKIIETVDDWCRQRPVRLCVLFGSQATGRLHPHSDVDLALWPSGSVPPLERLVSADMDPVVGYEIVRQGRLIFEEQPGLWAVRRAQLWHAYNDSLPFRRAARQRLREFAEEVRRDT